MACSLKYLNEQLDPLEIVANETVPLLEVQLELDGITVSYSPELSDNNSGSKQVREAAVEALWVERVGKVCGDPALSTAVAFWCVMRGSRVGVNV